MKNLEKYITLAKQHPRISCGIALAIVILIWII